MEAWRRRAMAYKSISCIPYGAQFLDRFRRMRNLESRFYAIKELGEALSATRLRLHCKDMLEIGSGWHPLMPLVFMGMGAEGVTMTDVAAHMKSDRARDALEYVERNCERIAAEVSTSPDVLSQRWRRFARDGHDLLRRWKAVGIRYLAPFDLTQAELEAESIDIIYSNSCLGYIPEHVLPSLFAGMYRLLRAGGHIIHGISTYDVYSAYDQAIGPVNFLRYPDSTWQRIGNSRIHYQNRLRPQFYIDLAKASGFEVQFSNRYTHHITTEMIDRQILMPEYRELPDQELTCASLVLVAQKQ